MAINKIFLSGFIMLTSGMYANISVADDATRNQEIVKRFNKCDTNKDGKLTRAEAKGCMPRVYDHFSYIDSGNKGYVTVSEIQALAG